MESRVVHINLITETAVSPEGLVLGEARSVLKTTELVAALFKEDAT